MLASAADYDNALVSLTAEVARTYTVIRTFEVLIQITLENVKVQEEGSKLPSPVSAMAPPRNWM